MHSQTALLLSLATATIAVPHTMPMSKRDGKYTCSLTGWDKRNNEVAPGDPGSVGNFGLEWGWSINLKDNELGVEYIYWSPDGDTRAPTAIGGVDFKPEDTRLDGTIHYDGSGDLVLDECSCKYKQESDTSDAEGKVFTGVLYNEENTKCTCEFACEPPQVTHGFCGVHVLQYQKPDPSKDNYKISVDVFDAAEDSLRIGANTRINAPTDFIVYTSTLLGLNFEVIPGAVDDDPLRFSYNGNSWDSNNGNCKVGKYDAGFRQVDCGFDC